MMTASTFKCPHLRYDISLVLKVVKSVSLDQRHHRILRLEATTCHVFCAETVKNSNFDRIEHTV